MDHIKNIAFIALLLSIIIACVVCGDEFPIPHRSTDGVVVGKGYAPGRRVSEEYIFCGLWWIDVYDDSEGRVGRIYLHRHLWAGIHVGDEWSHGLEEYD